MAPKNKNKDEKNQKALDSVSGQMIGDLGKRSLRNRSPPAAAP
jgi:hypothetical protein